MRFTGLRAAGVHLGLAFVVVVYAAMAVSSPGTTGLGLGLIAAGALGVWASLVLVTLPPRNRVSDGTRSVRGSLLLAVALGAGWLGGTVGSGLLVARSLHDPAVSELASVRGGPVPILVIGFGWGLVFLVRSLVGGLHLWRLSVDDEGVHYRGWRTDRRIAWDELGSAALDTSNGLLLRPGGAEEPVRVPLVCFDVPGRDLLAVVEEGRERHRRGRGPTGFRRSSRPAS